MSKGSMKNLVPTALGSWKGTKPVCLSQLNLKFTKSKEFPQWNEPKNRSWLSQSVFELKAAKNENPTQKSFNVLHGEKN